MSDASVFDVPLRGPYAQRELVRENWLDQLGSRCFGVFKRAVPQRDRDRVVAAVDAHAARFAALSSAELTLEAARIGSRLREQGLVDAAVFECFALVRECAYRLLGRRHFDVQLYAGWVLVHGNAAEMATGEGKTLTATLAASTAALAGVPVHVITVNDYLVERDATALRPLYAALGLSVGTILEGMSLDQRRAAYACDITYCTNKELVFDYLKDRIALAGQPGPAKLQLERLYGSARSGAGLLMRGLHYAIIDEADSVLIDEARVPVIISRTADNREQTDFYRQASAVAAELVPDLDYVLDRRERRAMLTEHGQARIQELAPARSGVWALRSWREQGVVQAIVAKDLYQRDKHYLVVDDKICIIDEFTGRTMADRSWEMGLHQLIEAKENVTLTGEREPLAKISYQSFFRRYLKLAGMSGSLEEVAAELWNVYRLHTVTIPTHRPCARRRLRDRYLSTAEAKWECVVARASTLHAAGRPVLIGTRSVATSEELSRHLSAHGLPHQVLNARQDAEEAAVVARAGLAGQITVATNMAGRGTDIVLDAAALAAGGLHVIATERHEAGRIDRQLFGRAGRQGDAGSCECVLCLEDELITGHARVWSRCLAWVWYRSAGTVPDWYGRMLFRFTQKRIERSHARLRRELTDLDERRSDMLAFAGKPV